MNSISQRFEEVSDPYRAAYLIAHFIRGTLTIEETEELDRWVLASDEQMDLFEDMVEEENQQQFLQWWASRDVEQKLISVKKQIKFNRKAKRITLTHYLVAAGLIILLALTAWWIINNDKKEATPLTNQEETNVPDTIPVLKLANGRVIRLRETMDTSLNEQLKIVNGEAVYSDRGTDAGMHSIQVPRKKFFRLLLPDGTRVWMNALSSISYPAKFTGDLRRVTITGEAYFEVAQDKLHPFIVSANGTEVQALGTQFNVRAYDNVPSTVSLYEGSVKVSGDNRSEILRPGETLHLDKWKLTYQHDRPFTPSWIKGIFLFDSNTLEEIAHELERWYDAKFVFKANFDYHFTASISRSTPLPEVLQMLSRVADFHFQLDGNTVFITK